MIKYGLISETDARTLEKTIDLVCDQFPLVSEFINITEIGLYNCATLFGINEYINKVKRRNVICTGVDNEKDKPIEKQSWFKYIKGNSNEVYNQIQDNSQHLIFIDGGHDFPTVVSDYYCFRKKVKRGGYLCFHDSSPQAQGKDWQRKGSESDSDMFISVRKALNELGLLNDGFNVNSYREYETISRFSWELVFDEYDPQNAASGLCVFKKLY